MKTKILVALTIVSGIFFSACAEKPEPNTDGQEMITVQLGLGGEVDVQYEPMTKSFTDCLYGVQIKYKKDDISLSTEYAYGLFDNLEDMKIDLVKGYTYEFVVTMLDNAKNIVDHNNSNDEGLMFYSVPFSGLLENKFILSSQECYWFTMGRTEIEDEFYNIPNVGGRYVGFLEFTPSENNTVAKIDMLRACFGARFVAEGNLANSGTLCIEMADAPKIELKLSDANNQISEEFTFHDLSSIAYRKTTDYSKDISTKITWIRDDESVVSFGAHLITFKRNTTTVVTIKIEDEEPEETPAGISLGFEFAEGETGEMVEDGANDTTIERQ